MKTKIAHPLQLAPVVPVLTDADKIEVLKTQINLMQLENQHQKLTSQLQYRIMRAAFNQGSDADQYNFDLNTLEYAPK
jgi:hypothetical protein